MVCYLLTDHISTTFDMMETVKIMCVWDYGQVVLFDTEASY